MLAANIDLGILKLIAAAAVGVFLWWQQRKTQQADAELEKRVRDNDRAAGGPTRTFPAAPAAPPLETPEQEKLRRFLEALGVPAGQPPAPPPPPPARPVAPTVQDEESSPYRPARTETPRRPVVIKPARPVARPVYRPVLAEPEPEPMESRDAGYLEAPGRELAQAARFEAPVIPEVSVAVATPPAQVARPSSDTLTVLQKALRTPDSLRTAFLLKEILGAPKSAQETV